MSIKKDIERLLTNGVIDQSTAERIEAYYADQNTSSPDRQLIVFAILGALLIGLGIILIVAHNWDELSRGLKLFFSFLPMLVAQALCAFSLLKKAGNASWREGCSVFLILSVGACIAMVSQVYNLPSQLGSFLLTWVVLALPVVYVMRSFLASMMVIAGATWYGAEVGYFSYPDSLNNYYPLLILAVLPFVVRLFRHSPRSNAASLHSWLLSLSVVIMLGDIGLNEELLVAAYMALAAILYMWGHARFMENRPVRSNGFLVIGSLTSIVILLLCSFSWFWIEWAELRRPEQFMETEEMIALVVLTILAIVLFLIQLRQRPFSAMKPMDPVFLIFMVLCLIGLFTPYVVLLVNLLILVVSLLIIREGLRRDHLGILNYGLLIMMALVVCRFFDSDWSFVVRGLLFIAVGAGFFIANRRLVLKRRAGS